MTCQHKTPDKWVYADVEIDPFGGTEQQLVNIGGESTYEDIDIGRFKCTKCGEVFYYTGLWRDFYEKGIPCPGSSLVIVKPVPVPVSPIAPIVDVQQIIYALQRAERRLQAEADALHDQHDYGAEFPAADAERMREAIALLRARPAN